LESVLFGVLSTVGSAAIGGSYLVSWRVFDEAREIASSSTTRNNRREGLIDTQMTLAAIGICNLLFGWPSVLVAHYTGWESFQWPEAQQWAVLILNGLVEYIFDASCAVAICMTSPIIVAVASPLTTPLSNLLDHLLYPTLPSLNASMTLWHELVTWASWLGAVVTMIGVYLLQTKPGIPYRCFSSCCCYRLCHRRDKKGRG